ncbi:hypothetical protein Scep_010047 [Stephania cephalantha]|uniref:Uncharacterized protein n=1 Tax=Stephania cephalantha TaxID=152367 RepID=A0AAP0PGU9_9MAGN
MDDQFDEYDVEKAEINRYLKDLEARQAWLRTRQAAKIDAMNLKARAVRGNDRKDCSWIPVTASAAPPVPELYVQSDETASLVQERPRVILRTGQHLRKQLYEELKSGIEGLARHIACRAMPKDIVMRISKELYERSYRAHCV